MLQGIQHHCRIGSVHRIGCALAEHGTFEVSPQMPAKPNLMQRRCRHVGVDTGIPSRKERKSSLGLRIVARKRFQQRDKAPCRDGYLVVLQMHRVLDRQLARLG